jgi:hypothetical protein
MQHLKGVTYSDILSMPTYERRYFLSLLTKDYKQREEKMEEMQENAKTKGSKGNRTSKVSGESLKSKMRSGEIPNK